MGRRRKWNEMDKTAIPLAQLRRAFEVYNQTTGKSPNTFRWYSDKLALFERFLGDGCQLSDLTLESTREFIAHLQGRRMRHEHNRFVKDKEGPLSSSYIQGFARALRAFSTWLHAEGYTDANVLKSLKPERYSSWRRYGPGTRSGWISRLLAPTHAFLQHGIPTGARRHALALWMPVDTGCAARLSSGCRLPYFAACRRSGRTQAAEPTPVGILHHAGHAEQTAA